MEFIIAAINNDRAMAAKAATPTMTVGTRQKTSSRKAPRVPFPRKWDGINTGDKTKDHGDVFIALCCTDWLLCRSMQQECIG